MPFGGMKSPQFGVYLGLCNLILMFLFFGLAVRRKRMRTPVAALLFGSFGFLLVTILLTAAGRMDVRDTHYVAAKVARYLIPAMLNWAVFILTLFWTVSLSRVRVYLVPALATVLAVLLAISFLKLRWWLNGNTDPFVDAQIAEISIQNGVLDPRLLRALFPNPAFIADYLPLLKESRLSAFYASPGQWIGERSARLASSFRILTDEHTAAVYPVVSGLEVFGRSLANYSQVLFVNSQGTIVGFGRQLPLGLSAQFLSSHKLGGKGWIGFIPARTAARNFEIYLRDPRNGEVARLAGNYEVPRLTLVKAEEEGSVISGASWESNSVTVPDDVGPVPIPGPPPRGQIVGTWRDSSITGEFRSSTFPAPTDRCLILPVLHGADSQLLSVKVVDGGTGREIATIPMQDNDLEWQFWRVPLDGAKNLQIIAQDRGPGLREWLALATPARCP
jgi:hypothetical protein